MTDDVSNLADKWASHGIELRALADHRYYLVKTYTDHSFVIRHATDTRTPPSLDDPFRVWMHDRETCKLSSDVLRAEGIDQLHREIAKWHLQVARRAPGAAPIPLRRTRLATFEPQPANRARQHVC